MNRLKPLFPRMHGSWSIWLASTLLGFGLADFKISFSLVVAFIASLFILLSIQPAHIILTSDRRDTVLYIPLIGVGILLVVLVLIAPLTYLAIIPYVSISAFLVILRHRIRAYIAVGSIILTMPTPLFHLAYYQSVKGILVPWVLLILISMWGVALAEDLLFLKKIRYSPPSFSVLVLVAFIYSSLWYAIAIIIPVAILTLTTAIIKVKTKYLGLSLLGIELYFAIATIVAYSGS
jgi:hypothetical protein